MVGVAEAECPSPTTETMRTANHADRTEFRPTHVIATRYVHPGAELLHAPNVRERAELGLRAARIRAFRVTTSRRLSDVAIAAGAAAYNDRLRLWRCETSPIARLCSGPSESSIRCSARRSSRSTALRLHGSTCLWRADESTTRRQSWELHTAFSTPRGVRFVPRSLTAASQLQRNSRNWASRSNADRKQMNRPVQSPPRSDAFSIDMGTARNETFGGDHEATHLLKQAARGIAQALPPQLAGARVRPSVGQGNWAASPWIAVLDPRITTTTQEGVYPVLLIREDLTGLYVTIAQGVTKLKRERGQASVRRASPASRRASPHLSSLTARRLHRRPGRVPRDSAAGAGLRASVVMGKYFAREDLSGSSIDEDVAAVNEAYASLIEDG